LTVGARYSKTKFSFNTLTGGPQLFLPNQANTGDKRENSFTPKADISWQIDPKDLLYFTYAKGFRPGGANNPVPFAACQTDFTNLGITQAPPSYSSDTVDSYEIGAKNSFADRVKIATSVYYINWHNIQQRLVPPICQISFIANLGTAVAKGADFQGEFLVTDSLTAELTAGFTSARYTHDSTFNSGIDSNTGKPRLPIVESGDAITGEGGQPIPPFTASAGLQYRFNAWSHDLFVRADYEYQGRARWLPATQDPNTLLADPNSFTVPATSFVSLRAGAKFGEMQLEPFIDNLLDTHPVTNYSLSIYQINNPQFTRLQTDYTFRPRTFGITFTFRR